MCDRLIAWLFWHIALKIVTFDRDSLIQHSTKLSLIVRVGKDVVVHDKESSGLSESQSDLTERHI